MLKNCHKCKLDQELSNFYFRHGVMENNCITCRRSYSKEYRRTHSYDSVKNYHQTQRGKLSVNRASQKAYIKHREKWRARYKLRYEVKKGNIIKPFNCSDCKKKLPLQGHHEDYTKPLEVIWLCSKCHAKADKILESKVNLSSLIK